MDIERLCPLCTEVFRVLELDLLVFICQLAIMRAVIPATSDRCTLIGNSCAFCCSSEGTAC